MNSEAKNMASVTFFKTISHVEDAYFGRVVWGNLMVLLCIFLILNSSHHSLQLLKITATFFPVKLQQCVVV